MNSNNNNKRIDSYLFKKEEMLKRVSKYLLIGLLVFVTAYYVPKNKLEINEVLFIGISASAAFGIIDVFYPSVCIV